MSKIRSSAFAFVFVVFATFFVAPTAFADDATDGVDLGEIVAQIVDEVVAMITGDGDPDVDEMAPYIIPQG